MAIDTDIQNYVQNAISSGADPEVAMRAAHKQQSQRNIQRLDQQSQAAKADVAKYGGVSDGGGFTPGNWNYTLFNPESNANVAKLAPIAAAGFTGGLSIPAAALVTGLAAGGGEIARQVGNHEDVDAGKALSEGAVSGGTSLLAGGLLSGVGKVGGAIVNRAAQAGEGAVAGEGGNLLTETGDALRKSVVKPMVKASPFGAEAENEIASSLQGMGFKGSAADQYAQLGPKMKDLGEQIGGALSKNSKAVSTATVVDDLTKGVMDNTNFDPDNIPSYKTWMDHFMGNLKDKGQYLSAQDLYALKQKIAKQIPKAFEKDAAGGMGQSLTPKEEIGLEIWHNLDKHIADVAPEVKDLTRQQSFLYKAAPGLKAARDGAGHASAEVLGTKVPIPGEAVQAVKDAAGTALQNSGGVVSNAITKGAQKLAPTGAVLKQAGTVAAKDAVQAGLQGQEQYGSSPAPAADTSDPLGAIMAQGSRGTAAGSGLTLDQIKQAQVADALNGGLNTSELQKLKDTLYPNVSTEVQKSVMGAHNASSLVDQLSHLYDQAYGGNANNIAGRAQGAVLSKIGPVIGDKSTTAYQSAAAAFVPALNTALTGMSRFNTDEVKQIEQTIPSPSDTPVQKAAKIANLKFIIASHLQAAQTAPQAYGAESSSVGQ